MVTYTIHATTTIADLADVIRTHSSYVAAVDGTHIRLMTQWDAQAQAIWEGQRAAVTERSVRTDADTWAQTLLQLAFQMGTV